MNKKIIVTIIIISIILIVIFGFILIEVNRYSKDEELIITLKPNDSGLDYYVNIPILIENSDIPQIISKLNIKHGNGKYEIIDSRYGKILNISSSNEFVLKSNINIRTNKIEETESYFNYKWSTIPIHEDHYDEIKVRGGSIDQNITMNLTIEIYFKVSSNKETSYAGERECEYDGVIEMDNEWKILNGYDNCILA